MTTRIEIPSVFLFYTSGSSDKTYQVQIEPSGVDRYVVNFQYGRRGGTLKYGTKTESPVNLYAAQRIFDDLVESKKAKGYTEDLSGRPYAPTPRGGPRRAHITVNDETNDTIDEPVFQPMPQAPKIPAVKSDGTRAFNPQLLTPIKEEDASRYIYDDAYMAEEKKNGNRVGIENDGKAIRGFNKKGQERPLPTTVVNSIPKGLRIKVDGELIGDVFHIFDILSMGGIDFSDTPAIERAEAIESLGLNTRYIKPIEIAKTTAEKRAMFDRLKRGNAEGIVFKLKNAPYTPGRPNEGGPQVKCKFYHQASVIVLKINAKRSIRMGVMENGEVIDVGNCTIPPNKAIPPVGAFVEVRYLYAYKGGSIYQPVYDRDRSDELDREDCRIEELVYKAEDDE